MKPYLFAIIFGLMPTMLSTSALSAPKAETWSLWDSHNPNSTQNIDHSAWQQWLNRHLIKHKDGVHRVNYAQVSPADKTTLSEYVKSMQNINIVQHNRRAQYAYWMNLYNARTVLLILEHYPVKSIRNISASAFGLIKTGPWNKKLMMVNSTQLSLNDIEHRILRPIYKDPLTHYGLNCASIGCPNLSDIAFTQHNVKQVLPELASAFINHSRGANVNDGKLTVSSIYHWFKEDFGNNDTAVIAHLQKYAQPKLQQALKTVTKIDKHQYDWALNQP